MNNVLTFQTGQPTTGEATARIGDGPPLNREQLVNVLLAGGLPAERAILAANSILKGTAYPPIVSRTAEDWSNAQLVKELQDDKALLLRALRAKLSPLWLRALDELVDTSMTSATLAGRIGVSMQQAGNICGALLSLGLVERKHIASPHPDFTGPGRSPWMWRSVRALRGDA